MQPAAASVGLLLSAGVGQQVAAMARGSRAARLLLSRPRRQPSSSRGRRERLASSRSSGSRERLASSRSSGSRERLASSRSSGSRERLNHHHDSSSSSSGRSRTTSRRSSSRRCVTRTAGSSRCSSISTPAGWVGCQGKGSNTSSRPLLQHTCKVAAAAADLLGMRSSQQGTSHLSSSMQARPGATSSLPQCCPSSQPRHHIHSHYGSCSSPSSRHQLGQAGVQLPAAVWAAQLGWLGTMRLQQQVAPAASGPPLHRTMTGDTAV